MAHDKFGGFKYLGLFTQLGLVMVFSLGLGVAIGYYVDQLLHTGVLFTVIFLVIGIGAGFRTAYELIASTDRDEEGSR